MNYIIAILVFGLLIFLHELGHFVVAKLSGITVLQFTVGFGPAIFKKQVGETLYAVRLLPLGGAVMMQGEEDEEAEKMLTGQKEFAVDEASLPPERSFAEASLGKRFAVSIAGVIMNFLTGIVIVFLLLMPAQYAVEPVISDFMDGFPYAAADNNGVGFEVGDRIVRVNDFHVFTMSDFSTGMMYDSDGVYDIVVERQGKKIRLEDFAMQPTVPDPSGQGMLYGFNLSSRELTFFGKIEYAVKNAMTYLQSAVLGIKMMFTGQVGTQDMMGTVGIANQIGEMARVSLSTMWNFVAYISINLAFVNLLPIPGLDGGKLLFLLIELVRGEKLDPKYEGVASLIGIGLLLVLFVFVTYHDILRIIR
ncbi:MAG: site-2 protease family protein [Clostridia bacterium]|nr:site-2 protease family protein [Clostridia bacterium]